MTDKLQINEAYTITGCCPRCGCLTISNGNVVWCTFAGSRRQPACGFRLDLRPREKTVGVELEAGEEGG